ncbi:MAG: hypothetical protein D6737_10905, partial [Chloroflexi bacterium]
INEDTQAVVFTPQASGGFNSYDFAILTPPTNFSTDPSDACNGQGVLNDTALNNRIIYCPPADFYSDEGNGITIDDNPMIEIQVTDRLTGGSTTGMVEIPIAKVQNDPLQQVNEDLFFEVDNPFTVFMKPFVQFENFNRPDSIGNPGVDPGADYPFTYQFISVDAGSTPNMFEGGDNATVLTNAINAANAATGNNHGLLNLDPVDGIVGFVEFTYRVTDDTGAFVDNTMILNIVTSLAGPGLYDDTAFQFTFSSPVGNTDWKNELNGTAINNTSHVSEAKKKEPSSTGNVASVEFFGDGFVLHMIGEKKSKKGGNFLLEIDPNNSDAGGFLPYTAPGAPWTCTVGSQELGGGVIANVFGGKPANYTITCTGIGLGTTNSVRITTLDNKRVTIDAIEIINPAGPLMQGFYDIDHPLLAPAFGSGWSSVIDTSTKEGSKLAKSVSKSASNGIVQIADGPGAADVEFDFTGSIIALQTVIEGDAAIYDFCVTPNGGSEICQTFDNSLGFVKKRIFDVFRPFSGLDPNEVHHARISITGGGRMFFDGVYIGIESPTETLAAGTFDNEEFHALNYNGGVIFDNRESRFGTENWVHNQTGITLSEIARKVTAAGPFLQFNMQADANSVSWLRQASTKDSSNILICVDRNAGVDSVGNCITVDLLTAPNPFVFNEADFGGWSSSGDHTVEIFSLTDAPFNFNQITITGGAGGVPGPGPGPTPGPGGGGTTLGAGLFDEGIGFDLSGQLNLTGSWIQDTGKKAKRAFGGGFAATDQNGDTAQFQFEGTGFGLIMNVSKGNANMQVCYEPTGMPAQQVCEDLATSNDKKNPTNWQTLNVGRVMPKKGEQYGFSFFGLANDIYDVTITHTGVVGEQLQLDAIAVFDNQFNEIPPGFYDDTQLVDFVNFAPAEFWTANTATKFSLPRGPFNASEHTTQNAGAIAQLMINGNTLTLYQTASKKNTVQVNFCLVNDTTGELECSTFNQVGKGGPFTPIAFIGLGDGQHHLVFENRGNTLKGGLFNIDAIAILP